MEKTLKNNKGITLLALVVTIIVLIILAGISLSMVLTQDGIFSKAEKSVDEYSKAKARETLELTMGEAQIKKYEEGLTEEELDNQIVKIEGELLPKEKPNPNLQNVIVEGYIFEIDRSVPKVVDYVGKADGVIITAIVSGNNGWVKPGDAVTVTGTIKTYSGGTITSSTATGNGTEIAGFPTNGGKYTISNITEDTQIIITAKDNNGKENTKTINVQIKRDTTGPTIKTVKVTSEGLKIKISATAEDKESGLKNLKYSIEPKTGLDKPTETFASGQLVEVISTVEGTYTVTIIAEDNLGNTTTQPSETVEIVDSISVEEVKAKINASNYKDYIGTKVAYRPSKGGTWRVFYYDANNDFGDGAGTIYLKRDYDETIRLNSLTSYTRYNPTDGGALLRQLNPAWSKGVGGSEIDLKNEHCTAWLCDSSVWNNDYKTAEAKYAIGAPSIEMWTKAYNAYVEKYEPSDDTVNCEIVNANGYGWGLNNGGLSAAESISIDASIPQSEVFAAWYFQWLASPSCDNADSVCAVSYTGVNRNPYDINYSFCPVVSLNH